MSVADRKSHNWSQSASSTSFELIIDNDDTGACVTGWPAKQHAASEGYN